MFEEQKDLTSKVISSLLRSEIFLPFGLELLNRKIILTDKVPLGAPAATDHKRIFINPDDEFFKFNSAPADNIYMFAYLHEICHIMFSHKQRLNGRNIHLWRYATDYFINLFLRNLEKENINWDNQHAIVSMIIDSYSDKICFDEDFDGMIEEEIYDLLQENGHFEEDVYEQSYKDFLDETGAPSDNIPDDAKIKVSRVKLEYNKTIKNQTFVEFPDIESDVSSDDSPMDDTALSKTMFESRVLSRGFESKSFEKFLKKMFKVKVSFKEILRDAILVELQKSTDISWGKPRMTWLVNPSLPYLPNYTEEETYGTIVILIDESASITDEDISTAISIVQQSNSYFKDVLVIKHDTTTKWQKLYPNTIDDKDIDELLVRRHSGGTSHKDAFRKVIEYSKQSDGYVSLVLCVTDLMSDIHEAQKILPYSIPRVYLRNTDAYKITEGIIGKIITIQS